MINPSAYWFCMIVTVIVAEAVAGPVDLIDDVVFWVGSGGQEAALAIDWYGQDATSQSLVWGYRWDGTATAADMFQAVVESDDRLFAKIGQVGTLGTAVFGIGYDASGDQHFAIDDGTQFDEGGIAQSGPADLGESVDPTDLYREGWLLGYWHHGIATQNENGRTAWASGPGLSGSTLTHHDWHSLAFTNSILDQSSFASGLLTAQPDALLGDFDRNTVVDDRDFEHWHDSFGAEPFAAGYGADGNRDWVVNADDFLIWQANFGNSIVSNSIPEPKGVLFFLASFVLIQWPVLRK